MKHTRSRRLWALALALLAITLGRPLAAQKAKSHAVPKRETFTNRVGMTFVKIPAGSFLMGASSTQKRVECTDCSGKGQVTRQRSHTEQYQEECRQCDGLGYHRYVDCAACNGTGWHERSTFGTEGPCAGCKGKGKLPCYDCDGTGRINRSRTVYDGTSREVCSTCDGKGRRVEETPEPGSDSDERPQHRVTLSNSFFLGRTEVTQGQWKAVMGTTPWSGKDHVKEGDDYPAVYVSWDDAQAFCHKLSEQEGREYRLPTEAEWEYACRAGTKTRYSFGDDEGRLGDYAWYTKNTDGLGEKYAHRVATKRPNPWGLFDMHGNAREWCQDWKGDYASGAQVDPEGPSSGAHHTFRGGGWSSGEGNCRTAYRNGGVPSNRNYNLGFRVESGLSRAS